MGLLIRSWKPPLPTARIGAGPGPGPEHGRSPGRAMPRPSIRSTGVAPSSATATVIVVLCTSKPTYLATASSSWVTRIPTAGSLAHRMGSPPECPGARGGGQTSRDPGAEVPEPRDVVRQWSWYELRDPPQLGHWNVLASLRPPVPGILQGGGTTTEPTALLDLAL